MLKRLFACLGLALLAIPLATQAQDYPSKAIRMIVPVAPGGSTDFTARLFATHLNQLLGQPVIADNRAGAGGTVGTGVAAAAPADGYTLMIGSNGQLSYSPNLYKSLPYNTDTAFAPISQVSSSSFVLVVHPSLPVHSVKELVDYAKANPGKLNNGSAGTGSTGHLAMELFKKRFGLDITHVPYKGSAPMVAALVGGEVQMAIVDIPPLMPFIKAGSLRPLAVSGNSRSALLPALPTIAESGVPGAKDYYIASFLGFLAPAGTPRPIIDKLHDAIVKITALPEVQKTMIEQGLDPIKPTTPEQFATFLLKDRAEAKTIIEAANIKPE